MESQKRGGQWLKVLATLLVGFCIPVAIYIAYCISNQEVNDNGTRPFLNGVVLIPFIDFGHGTLEIENGTSNDAVVKLVKRGEPHASCVVYVSARNMTKITSVPQGVYSVVFALGLRWNGNTQRFRELKWFGRFDDPLQFVSPSLAEYTAYSLTLHPVAGGNARTSVIEAWQFDAY